MTLEDDRPARAAPSAAEPAAAPTAPPAPPGPRDLLSQVLLGLRLEGIAYTRSHLRAPWGVALAAHAQTEAVFHFVARGSCWLRVEDGEWLRLSAGDAVLLPRGSAHVLASAQDVPGAQFDSLARKAVASNIFLVEALAGSAGEAPEGGQTSAGQAGDAIFSGTLRFDLDPLHPLLAMMPTLMHAGALAERDPLVPTLLDAMERELAQDRVGSCGILARMADVLAASIIRAWMECACGASQGWLAAVQCHRVGQVMAAIHAEPEADWTVPRLAGLMNASRSRFADTFTRTVGESPARYVTRVRMALARRWIEREGLRVSEAATRLGYDSDAAFSRAFKRVVGSAPGALRPRRGGGAR